MRTPEQILEELEVALYSMTDERATAIWFTDGNRKLSFQEMVEEVRVGSAFGRYMIQVYGSVA